MLSNQNTPREDNVGKEHVIVGDYKSKNNNKKGNNEDEDHLKKYRKRVKERNDASMSNY